MFDFKFMVLERDFVTNKSHLLHLLERVVFSFASRKIPFECATMDGHWEKSAKKSEVKAPINSN